MSTLLAIADEIHSRAMIAAHSFRKAEADLLGILQEAEEHRIFIRRGHSSLFHYVTMELGIAENLACTLITVARKCREVPELKSCLRSGQMHLSNARRIAAVLNQENKDHWLQKACALTHRQLEKEIAQAFPGSAVQERIRYISGDRVKIELSMFEREMLRLRRAQELLCQSKGRAVNLEETVAAIASDFLRRHDPVEKAKRHQVKNGKPSQSMDAAVRGKSEKPDEQSQTSSPGQNQIREVGKHVTLRVERSPIPAAVLHQVNWRDKRRCTSILPDGQRCNQSRWTEIHHIQPVSQGGQNTIENLITLCAAHHRHLHEN